MKINTTDPDLRTIYARINEGSMDLQPDFQRAEVWKLPKKRLLIDTILRGWQVPPVHVILNEETDVQEVLDGQQRLSAIRDFMSDGFKILGSIDPKDDDILALDGLIYSKLPSKVKNRFDRYAVRVFEIVNYNQGEPGELFNRLNESLKLTSAEKRNAYVGDLRNQMKSLVEELGLQGLDQKFLGFSNQRMAYHDMFIKLCYMLECNSLTTSYTEKQLNDRARDDTPFSEDIIDSVKLSINVLSNAKKILDAKSQSIHVTKATFTTWLYFISELDIRKGSLDADLIEKTFVSFEVDRQFFRVNNEPPQKKYMYSRSAIKAMLTTFNTRASSLVMTAGSLIIRDLIVSIFYIISGGSIGDFDEEKEELIKKLLKEINGKSESYVLKIIDDYADDMQWDNL